MMEDAIKKRQQHMISPWVLGCVEMALQSLGILNSLVVESDMWMLRIK